MSSHARTRGFSLIELMVSIGIIALLLSLALPAFGGARASAMQLKAQANLRSTHTMFESYANEHGNHVFRAPGTRPPEFPDDVGPGSFDDNLAVSWHPPGVVIATSEHWDHEHFWPAILMSPEDWPGHFETWVSPGKEARLPEQQGLGIEMDPSPEEMTSIRYAHSFVARPTLWMPDRGDEVLPEAEIAAVRPSDVRTPSNKVMLWDRDLAYLSKEPEIVGGHYRERTPMAFADGHADLHDPTAAGGTVNNPLNQTERRSMTLHNTENGVHGQDY